MPKSFSYAEYQLIIQHYQKRYKIMDFSEITLDTSRYCVIRHDVEFSVERALNLAQFEANILDVSTSYLFQIRNNCYNLASDINLLKLHQIQDLGHTVGLHVHMGLMDKSDDPVHFIQTEAEIFEKLTGIQVDRFSFHRPDASVLKDYLEVPNLINCYDKKFFHHYESPHNNLDVKYFTDSRHEWKHGYPLDENHDKVQILTHPYSWTETGFDNEQNYRVLLQEKDYETRQSIQRETSTFPKHLEA